MFSAPRADLVANTAAYENEPLVKPTGFREYDARWLFGPEINLLGVQALGLGLGTYIHELGQSKIVVGHDFRSYSTSIKNALILGLISAGCEVHDIGLALSPTAYFAQFDLDIPCVAMVTASHNENGWTGVKMGAQKPLTFGPDEMSRLKDIVLNAKFVERNGGKLIRVAGEAMAGSPSVWGQTPLYPQAPTWCTTNSTTYPALSPPFFGAAVDATAPLPQHAMHRHVKLPSLPEVAR